MGFAHSSILCEFYVIMQDTSRECKQLRGEQCTLPCYNCEVATQQWWSWIIKLSVTSSIFLLQATFSGLVQDLMIRKAPNAVLTIVAYTFYAILGHIKSLAVVLYEMLLCNFTFSGTEVLFWQIVASYARWCSSHHINWCETKWLKRFTSNWKSWWSLLVYPPVVCYSMFFLLIASVFFGGGVFPFVFPLCFFPSYVVSQYHGWVFLLLPDLQ